VGSAYVCPAVTTRYYSAPRICIAGSNYSGVQSFIAFIACSASARIGIRLVVDHFNVALGFLIDNGA
jgi:hypothetical protein